MHVGKATGCYAGIMHWQRCHTRGESQGTYITYASAKSNKAEPTLAFKPRGDITRSPKQGYQYLCPTKILKKNEKKEMWKRRKCLAIFISLIDFQEVNIWWSRARGLMSDVCGQGAGWALWDWVQGAGLGIRGPVCTERSNTT